MMVCCGHWLFARLSLEFTSFISLQSRTYQRRGAISTTIFGRARISEKGVFFVLEFAAEDKRNRQKLTATFGHESGSFRDSPQGSGDRNFEGRQEHVARLRAGPYCLRSFRLRGISVGSRV